VPDLAKTPQLSKMIFRKERSTHEHSTKFKTCKHQGTAGSVDSQLSLAKEKK
jgi:hypothetical protein